MNGFKRAGLALGLTLGLTLPLAFGAVDGRAQSVIDQVIVSGNQRIEPETIASYMTIRVGDPFEIREIDDSLKSLFATGLFADVTIRREGTALVVQVVENPIINRIAFEGNQSLDSEELEAEVQLRPRTVYTRTKVQSDVARVLELYRRDGRFNATVEPKVILQEQNRIDLVFEIDEGDATVVREINFIGNAEFSDGSLRQRIMSKETAWFRFLSQDDTYDPDRLAFDQELLRRFYLSEGYADFRVISVVADLTADRREFFITFTIEEGPRYEFGEVIVSSTLVGVDPAMVEDMIYTDPGDWYDAEEVEEVTQEVTLALGDQGFAFVNVRPRAERDRETLKIDLDYQISRADPLYIERIDVFGNIRTADEVIRREFKLAEGDAFNLARLQRSEQRIRALDFFNNITISRSPGSQPDTTIIAVEVEEKSTGELSIGAGFSTFDSVLFNISIRERNLLGNGQRLSLDLALSGRRQNIDLSFTEPYFLNRDLAVGFDLFRRRLDLQDESSFEQENIGGVLRMSYAITEHLRQTVFYTLQSVTIEDIGAGASIFVLEQEGTSVTSSLGEQLDYDRRDDALNPTSGYLLQHSTDIAGFGGTEKYIRNRMGASYFYPFAIDWTGNLRAEGGVIQGIFGEDVSIADRFFLGGGSLRGFEPAGVGPRDLSTDDALGGNVFWTSTAELTVPLGLPRELGLLGRVFTDFGSLFDLDSTGPSIADVNSVRASVGVGLSYNSPLGPIQLDVARAILEEDFDKTELFRFSFGTAF
ncbi:MAG: outer membrane protein assembly factor BamA [Rhodospirillaceae bacterium]|nr:outer membrane protein assembly factor BamA [Rhodospirillaceae bacterium]